MMQDPGGEDGAVGADDLPPVGVVVPALVGVADRYLEAEGAVRLGDRAGTDDVSLAGLDRERRPEPEAGQERDDPPHAA